MLSILLLLAAAPQSAIPPAPGGQGMMRVLGTPPRCTQGAMAANDRTSPGNGLMWREGDDAVGHYRLLDRRVNGCPDPVIVRYRVPGSNAIGREAGQAPAPAGVR